MQMRRPTRDGHSESGSRVYNTCHADGSPMQPDEFLHKRQANAGALLRAGTRPTHPMETLEELRKLCLWDASPVIADRQRGLLSQRVQADPNLAREGELHGIGDEVQND